MNQETASSLILASGFLKKSRYFFVGTKVFVMVSCKSSFFFTFSFQDILNQDAVLGFGKNL